MDFCQKVLLIHPFIVNLQPNKDDENDDDIDEHVSEFC